MKRKPLNKDFVRQSRLPRGAYIKTLEEVIAPYKQQKKNEKNNV